MRLNSESCEKKCLNLSQLIYWIRKGICCYLFMLIYKFINLMFLCCIANSWGVGGGQYVREENKNRDLNK